MFDVILPPPSSTMFVIIGVLNETKVFNSLFAQQILHMYSQPSVPTHTLYTKVHATRLGTKRFSWYHLTYSTSYPPCFCLNHPALSSLAQPVVTTLPLLETPCCVCSLQGTTHKPGTSRSSVRLGGKSLPLLQLLAPCTSAQPSPRCLQASSAMM